MTDKKLTDKEIIKAYEYCINHDGCEGCICATTNIQCIVNKPKLALDLFKRYEAENEKFRKVYASMGQHSLILIENARVEAYKEFAEYFKKQLDNDYIQRAGKEYVDFIKAIADNTYKELVGDNNGKTLHLK